MTKASPRKFRQEAIQLVSSLRSKQSELLSQAQELQKNPNHQRQKELLRATRELEAYQDWLKPEIAAITANPKQVRAIEAFWGTNRPQILALIGANQSGKTYCGGRMCFIPHLRDEAKPGSVYWCVAPNFEKSVSKQQDEFWKGCPRQLLGDASYDPKNGFGQVRPTLVLDPKDRRIVVRFKTVAQWDDDPRSYESEEVSGVWIDESCPEELHDALLPRIVARGGFMVYTTIPNVIWMHERFEESPPGSGVEFIKLGILDNQQNLDAKVIDTMFATMSEEEQQMRLFGNFQHLSGLVYKEFNKKVHVCKPFKVPRYWPKWRAMDWGNASPTACLWVTIAPNGTMYVYREYYERGTTARQDAERILAMSKGETYMTKTIVDPAAFMRNQANMESIADHLATHGLPCQPGVTIRSTQAFEASVQRVREWLYPGLNEQPMFKVFDTCPNLISEFRRWKYKTNKLGRVDDSDKFEKKNDHALDALRYLICMQPRYTEDAATGVCATASY